MERQNEEEKELSKMSDIVDKSDIQDEDKRKIIECMRREEFRGPLPHPAILKQYEDIQTGFANQIMQMAQKEQNHRQDLEKKIVESELSIDKGKLKVIDASIKMKSRLQIFGFVLTFFLVIIGFVCIFMDKNSFVPFILAIGSFCWTMFYGKKEPNKESNDESNNEES